jgi:hypothetical protein
VNDLDITKTSNMMLQNPTFSATTCRSAYA